MSMAAANKNIRALLAAHPPSIVSAEVEYRTTVR
jgi:hypothetical protein